MIIFKLNEESVSKKDEQLVGDFSLCTVNFSVKEKARSEYEISFIPTEDIALSEFKICFDLKEHGFSLDKTTLYNAGCGTNTFAIVYKGDEAVRMFSRDIFMLKGDGGVFNMAFTSFERFYTCFYYEAGVVECVYNLEEKFVKAGEKYTLETVIIDRTLCGVEFFDFYTELLKKRFNIETKPVLHGWSSWSCYYNAISEDKILAEAKLLKEEFGTPMLLQIDDGWEAEGPFASRWTNDTGLFPNGIKRLSEKLKEMGFMFGLWYAPALISETASIYEEYKEHINTDDVSFSNVRPFNLSQDFTLSHVRDVFKQGVEEYGCEYFKIDFLVNMLTKAGNGEVPVIYKEDYSVALYRKFIKTIRETVGDDVFLLACGSPIGESIGVFDSIRTSPDITWGGSTNRNHPGAWEIMKMDVQNVIRRGSYNNIFVTDPDGLVLRHEGNRDDGLFLSDDEALVWATTVAFSGGQILLNEKMADLPENRKKMYADIIPAYGVAARPVDFFEYPFCTHTKVDKFQIFYNWNAYPTCRYVTSEKESFFIDCHSKEILRKADKYLLYGLPCHSCRAVLVKEVLERPFVIFCNENIYLGEHSVTEKYEDGILYIDAKCKKGSKIYVYLPSGSTDKIVLSDQDIATLEIVNS